MSHGQVRAAIVGTGKLARDLFRYAPASGVSIVAATTSDPVKRGQDVGSVLGDGPAGLVFEDDIDSLLKREDVDVVLYAGFGGAVMLDVLEGAAGAGISFITSSGMFEPTHHLGLEKSSVLDAVARGSGARLLGTGMFPGFLPELFPAMLATTMPDPVTIHMVNISNVAAWSTYVHTDEIGIGRDPSERGETLMAYVLEALYVLKAATRVPIDDIECVSDPVVADRPEVFAGIEVAAGMTNGFRYRAIGRVEGEIRLVVEWRSLVEGLELGTRVELSGPDGLVASGQVTLPLEGAYPATAARMIKSIRPLLSLPAGLRRADEVAVSAVQEVGE